MLGYEGSSYTLYEDDGVHKEYDKAENYRKIRKNSEKKVIKKQILSMLKNTSKKDMMSTIKSNKTKNENQRFVV